MELKKINILSFSKIATVFGFLIGILSVVMSAIVQKILKSVPLTELIEQVPQFALTWQIGLITIISYALIGFVWGVIVSFAYNIIAKLFGGIKFDFKKQK